MARRDVVASLAGCEMRILILTQWFDPEPTFKGLLFARALRDEGHEVEWSRASPTIQAESSIPATA